jgi:hypothetical protein
MKIEGAISSLLMFFATFLLSFVSTGAICLKKYLLYFGKVWKDARASKNCGYFLTRFEL